MTNTSDLRVVPFSFESTEITVEAISQAGRDLFGQMFGWGCVSVTLPKSRGEDFAGFLARKGLRVG